MSTADNDFTTLTRLDDLPVELDSVESLASLKPGGNDIEDD